MDNYYNDSNETEYVHKDSNAMDDKRKKGSGNNYNSFLS
ncbi:hypothetical protein MNB_SV-13-1752 [hydrothermal vent metagenome]|uniref:Uncharacterized protein n=1 Tax=hydrothermal vent metagenome TaxID=652676 RepID=A0A1W1CIF3_9ZZZZ